MEKTLKELEAECKEEAQKLMNFITTEDAKSNEKLKEAFKKYRVVYEAYCEKLRSINDMKG